MIPVIVGVADVKNRSTAVEDAKEPAQLMLEAIRLALEDASQSQATLQKLKEAIDSINVVRTWTWPYADLPGLLAEKLDIPKKHGHYSDHGGNQPAKLLDNAALRVAKGESKVAVVTGAEALASLTACFKNGAIPPPGWTEPSEPIEDVFSPTTRDLQKDVAGRHSVGAPIQVYPLYENGFRAHRGQSIKDNNEESAILYGGFSDVAQSNEYAWNSGSKETAASIGTVSKKNRMICFPYPLLMNAFNTVNLSAACVVTSTEYAKQLQIPEDKWIYPLGGAGFKEKDNFWERPNFFHSSAISESINQCLTSSNLSPAQIDIHDFYSCFPIVPKLACDHLGLSITSPEKPITVLGGLTSFGGAGNNYSMHAITEMTRQLRNGSGRNALILANGGVLSYQHVVSLSRELPQNKNDYPDSTKLQKKSVESYPTISEEAEGDAIVETYTVEFKRDGSAKKAYIVGRLRSSGDRFLANHGDDSTLQRLASGREEPIGKSGVVSIEKKGTPGQRRNLFTFESNSKL